MSINHEWLFPVFTDHDEYDRSMLKLSDFHIYTGSKCNRACDFCIVYGRPDGWYSPISGQMLDSVLEIVPPDATVKFYGGEPTIDAENVIFAMKYLREKGFSGWFTIFSNGVLAERVIKILESDQKCDVVLNYSILHGIDAEKIPDKSLKRLQKFAAINPKRIYSSHAGVFPYGRAIEFGEQVGKEHIVERMNTSYDKFVQIGRLTPKVADEIRAKDFRLCPRCRPSLRTDGVFHACPFAVESNAPHFNLGQQGETAESEVLQNYQKFLTWIDDVLEPEAERLKVHPCQVCNHKINDLPTFK